MFVHFSETSLIFLPKVSQKHHTRTTPCPNQSSATESSSLMEHMEGVMGFLLGRPSVLVREARWGWISTKKSTASLTQKCLFCQKRPLSMQKKPTHQIQVQVQHPQRQSVTVDFFPRDSKQLLIHLMTNQNWPEGKKSRASCQKPLQSWWLSRNNFCRFGR